MKIAERIKHLKDSALTAPYWIWVFDNRTEYSPHDIGFFLEDADLFLSENYGVLSKELDNESRCTRNGVKCICLGWC